MQASGGRTPMRRANHPSVPVVETQRRLNTSTLSTLNKQSAWAEVFKVGALVRHRSKYRCQRLGIDSFLGVFDGLIPRIRRSCSTIRVGLSGESRKTVHLGLPLRLEGVDQFVHRGGGAVADTGGKGSKAGHHGRGFRKGEVNGFQVCDVGEAHPTSSPRVGADRHTTVFESLYVAGEGTGRDVEVVGELRELKSRAMSGVEFLDQHLLALHTAQCEVAVPGRRG